MAVIAFAAMLGWLGWTRLRPPPAPDAGQQTASREPAGRLPDPAPGPLEPSPAAPEPPAPPAVAPSASGAPAAEAPAAGDPAASRAADPVRAGAPPSFDVVRIEPDGDSVIAGRASPRARVRLLDNGREIAALDADDAGQFVILPPPLAAGAHELVLRAGPPDGPALASPQSVTVVVAETRDRPPLVTLTAPGQPSTILSRPDAPPSGPAAVASRQEGAVSGRAAPVPAAGTGAGGAGAPPSAAAGAAEPRIVAVESEGAGRLYVSGLVPPSSSVRLYLNDAFVAAADAAADGRLAFAIESGVRPGGYRVRLDVVDAATGAVRSRAEVPFVMPAQVAGAGPSAAPLPPPAPGRAAVASAAPSPVLPAAAPPAAAPGARSGPPVPSEGPSAAPGVGAAIPASGSGGAAPDARPAAAPPGAGAPAPAQPDVTGRVAAAPAPDVTVVPEVNTAIVARGDSLWQISKRIYGQGLRYTVIFGANTPQIRDPDLIYPGQVFVLPSGASATATR